MVLVGGYFGFFEKDFIFEVEFWVRCIQKGFFFSFFMGFFLLNGVMWLFDVCWVSEECWLVFLD